MGIPIPGKDGIHIDTGPRSLSGQSKTLLSCHPFLLNLFSPVHQARVMIWSNFKMGIISLTARLCTKYDIRGTQRHSNTLTIFLQSSCKYNRQTFHAFFVRQSIMKKMNFLTNHHTFVQRWPSLVHPSGHAQSTNDQILHNRYRYHHQTLHTRLLGGWTIVRNWNW